MYLSRKRGLDKVSHDLLLDGNKAFMQNIIDFEMNYSVGYPYPIGVPSKYSNQNSGKFCDISKPSKERKTTSSEYKRFKDDLNDIFKEDFADKNHLLLPNFFVEFVENSSPLVADYGYNSLYSHGVVEQFTVGEETFLIHPSLSNNLMICSTENPTEETTIQYDLRDPILNIQNMGIDAYNYFFVRSGHTINLIEINDNLQMEIKLRLNSDVGYVDSQINNYTKDELGIASSRNKIKIFDLSTKEVKTSYSPEDLNIFNPENLHFEFITENTLLVMTHKEIKAVDTRTQNDICEISINLQKCDMLINFKVMENTVFMTSKHCYFVHDVRSTLVQDFANHHLRSPPCYINFVSNGTEQFVTLFSQNDEQKVIFGQNSPFALPLHPSSIKDTYKFCRGQKEIPVIPDIKRRLACPITGVQLVSHRGSFSIYYTNVLGEIFRQDISLNLGHCSDIPINKMCSWLEAICNQNLETLNAVHFANATLASDQQDEVTNLEIYKLFERNYVKDFLECDNFPNNLVTKEFDEIWDPDEVDLETTELLDVTDSDAALTKVEKWIQESTF